VIDEESSMDLVVKEGSDMLLQCKAQGYPEPYIMWRREDGLDINYNGNTGTSIYICTKCISFIKIIIIF
jgi:hypothetical protein